MKQKFQLYNSESKASNSFAFEIEDKDIMSLFSFLEGKDDITVSLKDFMINENLEDYA